MALDTTSLSTLGNYLQNMESKFGMTIMETLLRLSALTDTSVFLLVDSPHGRRFCGKDDLCQSFMEGRMTYDAEKDLEMRLTSKDVGVSPVERRVSATSLDGLHRQRLGTPTSSQYTNGSSVVVDEEQASRSPSSSSVPAAKRRASPQEPTTSKTARLSSSSEEIKIETWGDLPRDNHRPSRGGSSTTSSSSVTPAAAPSMEITRLDDQPSQSSRIKEEIILNDSDDEEQERTTEASFDLTRFDAVDNRFVDFGGSGFLQSTTSQYNPATDGLLPLDSNEINTQSLQLQYCLSTSTTTNVGSDELPEVRSHLRAYLDADMKAAAVLDHPPEALLVKESAGYKILSSLLYDVGKKYGTLSLDADADSLRYFYVCFQEFCSYFPNFKNVFNAKIIVKNSRDQQSSPCVTDGRTFKTFMRAKMQRTFGRYSKRHT